VLALACGAECPSLAKHNIPSYSLFTYPRVHFVSINKQCSPAPKENIKRKKNQIIYVKNAIEYEIIKFIK
jgi:hypothetical protein